MATSKETVAMAILLALLYLHTDVQCNLPCFVFQASSALLHFFMELCCAFVPPQALTGTIDLTAVACQ